MKRAVLIFGLVAVFAGTVHAAELHRENGTDWNTIAKKWGKAAQVIKTNYLFGVLDAFYFMIDRADVPEGAPVFPRNEVNSYISGLDRFYGNPKNVKIPVVYALSIISMELHGVDKKTIEQAIQEKRSFWTRKGLET